MILLALLACGGDDRGAPERAPHTRGVRLGLEPSVEGVGWRLPGEASVSDVSWGDLDGDGVLDLLVGGGSDPYRSTSPLSWTYTLYHGTEGGFEAVTELDEGDARGSVWADFDGDGALDLLIAQTAGLRLYRGVDGGLVNEWRLDDDTRTTAIRAADVDGDGDVDVAQGGESGLWLWRNDGMGAFHTEALDEELFVFDAAWADLAGDGLPELTVGTYDGLWVLENTDGTPVLGEAPELLEGESVRRVIWADWVGDGGMHPALTTDDSVEVYAADSLGYQSRLSLAEDEDSPQSLVFADFDIDGALDLAVGWWSGRVQVLRGEDNYTGRVLTEAWEEDFGYDPVLAMAAADWDGDGDPDLAVGRGDEVGSVSSGDDRTAGVYESFVAADEGRALEAGLDIAGWAAGDVDGDGDEDLVVVSGSIWKSGAVFLAENDSGVLSTTTVFEFPAGTWARGAALGDVDGDDDLDLVVGTQVGAVLFLREADGYTLAWSEPGGRAATEVALADVDDDGDLDLAVGGAGLRMYASADGVFRLRTDLTDLTVWSLAFARLDADGGWQLAATTEQGLTILDAPADPEAAWVARSLEGAPDADGAVGLAAFDSDEDGRDELFVTGRDFVRDSLLAVEHSQVTTLWASRVSSVGLWFFDSTDPEQILFWSQGRPFPVDLENDGRLDIALLPSVLQRRGDDFVIVQSPEDGDDLALLDLDGDGSQDMLVEATNGLALYPNVRQGADQLPFNPPRLALTWGDGPPKGPPNARATALRRDEPTVALRLSVFDAESDPVSGLRWEFRDWRGGWRPATVEGLDGELESAPLADGGRTHLGTWRWADDGADGETAQLRVVLDRPSQLGGEIRSGRVAGISPTIRLFLDQDGDGRRESRDPCPLDPDDDSIVNGVCDSVTLSQGLWCGATRGGSVPAVLAALVLALRRQRHSTR